MDGVQTCAKALLSICSATAVLELLTTRDDDEAFGFRAVCALAVTLCLFRGVIGVLRK